jgi:hypothetical protein
MEINSAFVVWIVTNVLAGVKNDQRHHIKKTGRARDNPGLSNSTNKWGGLFGSAALFSPLNESYAWAT